MTNDKNQRTVLHRIENRYIQDYLRYCVILFWILDFGFWLAKYLTRQEFWKLKSCKSNESVGEFDGDGVLIPRGVRRYRGHRGETGLPPVGY
jgi:hypothetical protein